MNKEQEKQIALIKDSGLSQAKIAEITGIHYKKLYRVLHEGVELKYSEFKKLTLLNDTIKQLKIKCAEL